MSAQDIFETISSQYFQLTNSEKKVADYVLAHRMDAQYMSISELAEECAVADATISRFCRRLGLGGYNTFKLELAKASMAAHSARRAGTEEGGRDGFEAMCEVKALAYAMKDELLKGNLHSFGKLLNYGWESKKRMSSKITNPQVDALYNEAMAAGALGGKLLGAGGGGYLLMYCPYNLRHKVAARLEAAGGQLTDWVFELRGAQSWISDEDRWDYNQVKVQMPEKEYVFDV